VVPLGVGLYEVPSTLAAERLFICWKERASEEQQDERTPKGACDRHCINIEHIPSPSLSLSLRQGVVLTDLQSLCDCQ
jgi:hypothetical protein